MFLSFVLILGFSLICISGSLVSAGFILTIDPNFKKYKTISEEVYPRISFSEDGNLTNLITNF